MTWRTVALLSAVVGSTMAFAQRPPETTMVTVNGEAIKAQSYYRRMEVLPGVGRMANNKFVPASPGLLTLQQLINEMLIMQLAKKQGVFPTDAQVEQEIKDRLEDDPKLLQAFTSLGLGQEDLKYDVTVQLAEFKILTKGINVADLEVEKFYKDNPGMFTIPKQYKLRIISAQDEAKKTAVDAALKSGKTFSDVAKELSEDLSKISGGDIGNLAEYQLTDVVKAALQKTPKGNVTEWIKGEKLSIKFLIEDIIPEVKQAYNESMKRAIRKRLMVDRGQAAGKMGDLMRQMRKESKLEFPNTQFGEQLKKLYQSGE